MHHRALLFFSIKLLYLFLGKLDYAVGLCMDREIFTAIGVPPGAVLGAALFNDHTTGINFLPTEELHTEALAFAIPYVGG